MQYQATGYHTKPGNASTPGAKPIISPTEPIEQKRYEEIKNAKDACFLVLDLEEKLHLVLENFKEWEVEILSLSQSSLLCSTICYNSMEHRQLFNRRLTNLLTSFRLYIDQTDHDVSTAFGNPSKELDSIKQFKNSLYDRHFGYRFLEELRNYVQHCAMPVQMIRYESDLAGDSKNYVRFSIKPKMAIDQMESPEKLKRTIFEEVKSRGGLIDLRQPVREYVSCLILLHGELRKIFADKFRESRNYYMEAVNQYSKIRGNDLRYTHLEAIDEHGVTTERIDLIVKFLEDYDLLYRSNSSVAPDVAKAFVSNAL
jgi:hypothetical protein